MSSSLGPQEQDARFQRLATLATWTAERLQRTRRHLAALSAAVELIEHQLDRVDGIEALTREHSAIIGQAQRTVRAVREITPDGWIGDSLP